MPQMTPQELLFRLMAGGNSPRNDIIEDLLSRGLDVLSMGGVELARSTFKEDNSRTLPLQAAFTVMTGWTLPTITYVGRPICIELDIPGIVHSALPATVGFEIRGSVNGAAAVRFATKSTTMPTGTVSWAFNMKGWLPIPTFLPLVPGDEISGIQVYSKNSAATATLLTYFNETGVGFGTTVANLVATQF